MPEGSPAIVKGSIHKVVRYKSGCHPASGMMPTFVPELKLMILRCALCNEEVMRFEVAEKFSLGGTDGGKNDGQVRIAN